MSIHSGTNLMQTAQFRVFFNDHEVLDVISVSPLGQQAAEAAPNEAADTAGAPEAVPRVIRLERRVTLDPSFMEWMMLVLELANQPNGLDDLSVITRDVRIEQLDSSGNLVASWHMHQCRPVEYHPPRPVNGASEMSPERLFLQHVGCERIS